MKSLRLVTLGALYLALAGYGLLFALLHELSEAWATSLYYSLWFPPAGLRFAFLWFAGARHAPRLAIVEILIVLLLDGLKYDSLDQQALYIVSIGGPCLAYGIAIALSFKLLRPGKGEEGPQMQLGLAVLLAPVLGALCSLPSHYLLDRGDEGSLQSLVGTASVFVLTFASVADLNVPLLLFVTAIVSVLITWHGWVAGMRPRRSHSALPV